MWEVKQVKLAIRIERVIYFIDHRSHVLHMSIPRITNEGTALLTGIDVVCLLTALEKVLLKVAKG